MSEVQALAIIGAAVLAGIAWNTLGIWKEYRVKGEASIVWSKVKKNVIIGSILGVIGYGLSITQGLPVPIIDSVATFIGAVIAYFPLIVVADGIFANHEVPTEG